MSKLYSVDENGVVTATTSTGWVVECQPVADLLLRTGQHLVVPVEPQPPTYTVTGVGGATETKTYDVEGAADPKTPQEDKERWAAYVEAKSAYDAELASIDRQRNEMRGRFLALRGIKVRGLPDDLETWAAEQEVLYGLQVGNESLPRPAALLLAFVDQHVVRTQEDGAKITAGILRASGLDQEALDSVEATFLDTMGQGRRADAAGDTVIPAPRRRAKK